MNAINKMLTERINGVVTYIGKRRLRHSSEPNVKQEELSALVPEAVPHVFVDFTGARLSDVFDQAGGKQGCVVDMQKVIRDGSTLAEVSAWRSSFDPIQYANLTMEASGVTEKVLDGIAAGEPFVMIRFVTAGQSLDVPMQPADMLNSIQENAPAVYAAIFGNMSEEDALKAVPDVFHQLQAAMS